MFYLDTSVLVPLFIDESSTAHVRQILKRLPADKLTTSDWTRIEFSSALARDVRMGVLDTRQATEVDDEFQSVMTQRINLILSSADDYSMARRYLQRHEAKLRAGDVFHLAIASNHDAEMIYSLDQGMIWAGGALGLSRYAY